MDEKETYHSYLLRIWLHEACGKTNWCASLEETRSGERIGFQDLKALLTYLSQSFPESNNEKLEQKES
jgi:hypothetical protein